MPNRLVQESSLYLQQHAQNPVDWYPWDEEALNKAKHENKPILLSIGYSACHWCHVMANESFIDVETAKLMNENFVNIKVDREERPDLDKVYQMAHQLLTGRGGGWPLTMFLSPEDQTPFFGGTYFPLQARFGMPSFKEILQQVITVFKTRQSEIKNQNNLLKNTLLDITPKSRSSETLNSLPLNEGLRELEENFDKVNGGFGQAPKFPQATSLEFLSKLSQPIANSMLKQTLIKMAQGGIYDQIGGGFFRYSVDAKWNIPHFEKMLYDNAQLLSTYSEFHAIQNHHYFSDIADQTIAWLLRQMYAPEGAFYATLDADSEHHEGKYYYWDREEIRSILDEKEFNIFAEYFNLDDAPNFEGHWHLHVIKNLSEIADKFKIPMDEAVATLNSAKEKLLKIREQRIAPGRDEKIITSWNGLMLKGLAKASHINNEYYFTAQKIVDYTQNHVWKNKRLFATFQNGLAKIAGFLDDYVFLLEGLIEILQIKWNTNYLNFAIEIAESLLANFYDEKNGGFFFTANDQERIMHRPKTIMDEAVPSGNGVGAYCFLRLGYLLSETKYLDVGEKTIQMAWENIKRYPSAHTSFLIALQEYLQPSQVVIIRGAEDEITEWRKKIANNKRLVFSIPRTETNLPDALANKKCDPEKTVAYICEGLKCSEPIKDLKNI